MTDVDDPIATRALLDILKLYPGGCANDELLKCVLEAEGFQCSREWVRLRLHEMEEKGIVVLTRPNERLLVGTLLDDGGARA